MTLIDLIQKQSEKYMEQAVYYLNRSDKEFYKSIGRVDMCNDLCKMLSDETLKMEVKTRYDVLKGE
jgi:hypothetical protein